MWVSSPTLYLICAPLIIVCHFRKDILFLIAFIYVYVHMCLSVRLYVEVRIRHPILWNWSYRSSELPKVGAKNQTLKSNPCS